MRNLEILLTILEQHTRRKLMQDRVPLGGAHLDASFCLRLHVPHPDIEMEFELLRTHPYQGHNLGHILQMGMKHHYLDANPNTGDVRASVDYVKGFTEGSDALIAFAEEKLVRFIKYVATADDNSLFIPPRDNLYRARIRDLCEHALKEWADFKHRGFR